VRAKRFNEIEAALREIEGDLETDPSLRFALDHVVGPLISQRRFDAPLVSSALRQLVKWVSERNLTTAEAAALVQKLLSERRASVKPADITDAVKLAVNNRPTPRQLTGDPALMSEWPRVMAELQRMIGEATAQQVFSTFVIDRVVPSRGGRVVAYVATHEQWRKKSVELSMSAQFRAALCAAFPNVTDVFIETRRPAA
jgi:hypothetical protein